MKNKFLLGAVTGISALALAVPILAQVSSADSTRGAMAGGMARMHAIPTQEDVQSMIERDDALLANADAMVAILKTATQVHRTALSAAASIADDEERQTAVQKANEELRTTLGAAIDAKPELKGTMLFGGLGFGPHGHGRHGPGDLAQKLGMTQDELKAALVGGKSIEDIAKEKGVELPARLEFNYKNAENQTSSAQ